MSDKSYCQKLFLTTTIQLSTVLDKQQIMHLRSMQLFSNALLTPLSAKPLRKVKKLCL